MRFAVLASGGGSILEAMLDQGLSPYVVCADRHCGALEIAERAGIERLLIERESFDARFDRVGYSNRLCEELLSRDIELIAMAGFMTLLAGRVFEVFGGRILNTHPALLPAFKGAHAVRDAFNMGVKVTGCTIHIATPEMDSGPILAQRAVEVDPSDTIDSLHEKIKRVERELYPEVIRAFLAKEYEVNDPTTAI